MTKKQLDTSKFDYRGGTRFKKPLKIGSSILLRYIWLQNGGVEAVGKRFKMQSQHFVNWQRAGKVPLKHVGRISRGLKVNKYALNYDGMVELLGAGPSWEEVVKATVAGKMSELLKAIFKSQMPKHHKGSIE